MKLFKRKKKEIIVPVWEREDEYWLLYKKMAEAKARYLTYTGEVTNEREALKAEWLELEKLYTPLYQMREDWMDKSNVRPKIKEKDRLTKSSILMAVMTAFGMILPAAVENRGIIIKTAKDTTQRAWNAMVSLLKR